MARDLAARLVLAGGDTRDFLQRMVTAELKGLGEGDARPTFLLERSGRVVDRVLVVDRGADVLLLGNDRRAEADFTWLVKYIIADDVTVVDRTADTFLFTLLGAGGEAAVRSLGAAPDAGRAATVELAGETVTLARDEDVVGPTFHVTGPTAARAAAEHAFAGLVPLAPGDWQALRLLAGRPRWGAEVDERTLPLELGVVPELSLTKGCYLGQEVVARLHHQKRVKRRLVRLALDAADAPEAGDLLADGTSVGTLTGAARDEDGRVVGMGFVAMASAEPGTSLIVRHAGGDIAATVTPATEGNE